MLVEAPGLGLKSCNKYPHPPGLNGAMLCSSYKERRSPNVLTFSSEHPLRPKHSTREVSNNLKIKFNQQFISTLQSVDYVNPLPGAAILDLGCGAGELSTYLAELVGQNSNVIGVDPDVDRIKVAQETHKGVKNLSFAVGSTSNFPGVGSETYDIIYSNLVLHWVTNKKEAFKNMFTSLTPVGKIVLWYCDRLPTAHDLVYRELNPENLDKLLNMWHCETKPDIEQMCTAAGLPF